MQWAIDSLILWLPAEVDSGWEIFTNCRKSRSKSESRYDVLVIRSSRKRSLSLTGLTFQGEKDNAVSPIPSLGAKLNRVTWRENDQGLKLPQSQTPSTYYFIRCYLTSEQIARALLQIALGKESCGKQGSPHGQLHQETFSPQTLLHTVLLSKEFMKVFQRTSAHTEKLHWVHPPHVSPSLLWRQSSHVTPRGPSTAWCGSRGAWVDLWALMTFESLCPWKALSDWGRNTGKWNVDAKESILEVFLEAVKGKELGRPHASSLFTLLGDLEMSQATLKLRFYSLENWECD